MAARTSPTRFGNNHRHWAVYLLLLALVGGTAEAQGLPCFNAAWLQAGSGAKGLPASLVGNMTISGSGAGFDKYGNEYTVVEYVSRSVRLYNMGLAWSSSELLPGSMEMIEIRIKNKDRSESISTDVPSRVSPGEPTMLTVDFVNCRYSIGSDTHVRGVDQIESRRQRSTEHYVYSWGPTKDASGQDASGFAIQLIEDPALADPVRNGMKLQGSESFVAPEVNTDHAGIKVSWTVRWSFEPWSPSAEQRYSAGGLMGPPAGAGGRSGGSSSAVSGGVSGSGPVPSPECGSELKGMSPDPAYRLPGSWAKFSWAPASGIASYALKIGRYVGGSEYFDSGSTPLGAIGALVAKLPVDGSDVWARVAYKDSGGTKRCADVKYEAALFADSIDSFPVGSLPFGIAFDGRNVWVGNSLQNAGSLMKLDPRSGAVLQTIPIAGCPGHLAFDGTRIWTSTWCPNPSNYAAAQGATPLAAVRVSDGMPVGPAGAFPVLNFAEGLASTGTKVFAQFNDGQKYLACMSKDTPTQVMQIANAAGAQSGIVGKPARPIVADGGIIWSIASPSRTQGIVLGTRTSDCTNVKQFPFTTPVDGDGAYGLAADFRYVWVGLTAQLPAHNTLIRIEKSTGNVRLFAIGGALQGITSDGSHIWVVDQNASGFVDAIDPNTGQRLAEIPSAPSAYHPYNVLFDGRYLWVTNMNAQGTLTRIRPHSPLLPPPVKVP